MFRTMLYAIYKFKTNKRAIKVKDFSSKSVILRELFKVVLQYEKFIHA